MQKSTRDAIFVNKLDKIKESLEWIENNCSKKHKQEVSEAIKQASTSVEAGPTVKNMIRCSHELSNINPPPTRKDLKNLDPNKAEEKIREEIKTRKKLINGFEKEIQELKTL